MCRLLIVSNRLPVSVVKRGKSLRFQSSAGGLATGVSALQKLYKLKWIGWPGIAQEKLNKEEKSEVKKQLKKNNYYPVFLSQSDIDNYYSGFSNKTLWPLFLYILDICREINRKNVIVAKSLLYNPTCQLIK